MNTNKIWKNISKQLKYAKLSPSESEYQSAIFEIFTDEDFLGWPVERVKREYPVQMGSTKKSDIMLLDSDFKPVLAIEVKLSKSESDGVEQLGSYMDRCDPRLVFGVSIKDSFSLFYDENTGRSIHSINDAAITASFDDSEDVNGIMLVELLSFANFEVSNLKTVCTERLKALQKKNEYEAKKIEIKSLLSGESGKKLIREAVCQYLKDHKIISEGEECIVEELTETVEIGCSKRVIQPKENGISRLSKINYKFIPSIEDFVEYLKSNICYRHFVLNDGSIETQKWSSSGGITVNTVKPNITSTPFYRNNKTNIIEIILSPFEDPNRQE